MLSLILPRSWQNVRQIFSFNHFLKLSIFLTDIFCADWNGNKMRVIQFSFTVLLLVFFDIQLVVKNNIFVIFRWCTVGRLSVAKNLDELLNDAWLSLLNYLSFHLLIIIKLIKDFSFYGWFLPFDLLISSFEFTSSTLFSTPFPASTSLLDLKASLDPSPQPFITKEPPQFAKLNLH